MSEEKTRKVDMLAAAREAQWSADTFLGPGSTKVGAPAKVNLILGVGDRRDDGFHDVVNVMHAVSLHDVLHVRTEAAAASMFDAFRAEGAALALPDHLAVAGPADNLLVSVDCTDKTDLDGLHALDVPARDNIACRAVDALARAIGRDQFERVLIRIEKNVPHQGGLGGGSSDAAAVLVALASRWRIELNDPRLVEAARSLGSDVPFFLRGGCALFDGAGEHFARSLEPMKLPVVLVKPFVGVSTPKAYRAFDEAPIAVPAEVVGAAADIARAEEVPLFNNLAPAAEGLAPVLAEVRTWLCGQDGVMQGKVMLCGSGATTFAVTRDFAAACDIAAAAQSRGWWARACTFSSLRAAVVPRR